MKNGRSGFVRLGMEMFDSFLLAETTPETYEEIIRPSE